GSVFTGYGHTEPGFNAGSVAFCRTDIYRRLGRWRPTMALQLSNDAGLGTETDILTRYKESGMRLERVIMPLPAAATVITDPRGTSAKIRSGNRRYGGYFAPPNGRRYYRIWDEAEAQSRFCSHTPASAFEDIVEPLGFDLPLNAQGGLLK